MTLLLLTSMFLAVAMVPGPDDPLRPYHRKNRVFLIFGAEPSEAVLQQSDALFADPEGAALRALVILTIVGRTVSNSGDASPLPDAGTLRARFGLDEETPFTVILIGLDGMEKMRSTVPVARAHLFRLIDAMPPHEAEEREI